VEQISAPYKAEEILQTLVDTGSIAHFQMTPSIVSVWVNSRLEIALIAEAMQVRASVKLKSNERRPAALKRRKK
jgi:hypothetical protein